jgi:hypothetical protein
MRHNGIEVTAEVKGAADQLYAQSNQDLDLVVNDLVQDMRNRNDDDAWAFGEALVSIHETLPLGIIGERLHGCYLAALYRLARQQVNDNG